jgi:hypothetical protein
LEQDIRGHAAPCRELLQLIDATARGDEPPWEATGNAHTLTVGLDGAHIENEYAIPSASCDLSLDDLREAITTWLECLEGKRVSGKPLA